MKNADRITKMMVHVEFKCAGRTGYIDVEISAADMVSIEARRFIDERISKFVEQHEHQVKAGARPLQ